VQDPHEPTPPAPPRLAPSPGHLPSRPWFSTPVAYSAFPPSHTSPPAPPTATPAGTGCHPTTTRHRHPHPAAQAFHPFLNAHSSGTCTCTAPAPSAPPAPAGPPPCPTPCPLPSRCISISELERCTIPEDSCDDARSLFAMDDSWRPLAFAAAPLRAPLPGIGWAGVDVEVAWAVC
jgi:hypothetical protein